MIIISDNFRKGTDIQPKGNAFRNVVVGGIRNNSSGFAIGRWGRVFT